ncbi:Pol Polyprotein [Phytophthora palmivora]|uniref:Pol Polyprotein n=1 Tax=Phytophthora palmivora TaxID=4796 RepID=A0A2P4YGC3_9STRA|nr:Pol Polyprotein [Phytophthora palmivora]
MCVYDRQRQEVLILVGVYVDDLLVTGTEQNAMSKFRNFGVASKFCVIRVTYSEVDGYDLDQEVAIVDIRRGLGMDEARGVRTPIDVERNGPDVAETLPASGGEDGMTPTRFPSLVGRLMWIAHRTRPDIAYAAHKA